HVPPEEVVVQVLGRRLLEAEYLAALRVHAGHDVLDRAILTGRVHRLEDDQDGVAVVGVEQVLGLGQVRQILVEGPPGALLDLVLASPSISSARDPPGSESFSRAALPARTRN